MARQVPAVLLRPVEEEELAEAGPLDPLEELLGHDLVGVDVVAVEHADLAVDSGDVVHVSSSRCGCRRSGPRWRRQRPSAARRGACGRRGPGAPRSCGSRSRRSARPGDSVSGFMPRHIEQPATRQSKPAALKTSSRPSRSACALTCCEPGTTIALTPPATLRPLIISAAARRSPMRLFVHEPMKTRSSWISSIGVPGFRSMYCSARSSPSVCGSGTASVTDATMSGVGPPRDLRRERGGVDDDLLVERRALRRCAACASARRPPRSRRPAARPRGPRPTRTSSRPGATMPARPPPSIVMLQTVMRPSIESASIAGAGVLDDVAGRAGRRRSGRSCARIRSFAVTPKPSSPS